MKISNDFSFQLFTLSSDVATKGKEQEAEEQNASDNGQKEEVLETPRMKTAEDNMKSDDEKRRSDEERRKSDEEKKKSDEEEKKTVAEKKGKTPEDKKEPPKKKTISSVEPDAISEEENSEHSEEIIVYETIEDVKYVDEITMRKLARMGSVRSLWSGSVNAFFLILTFLTSYDSLIVFTQNLSIYGPSFCIAYCCLLVFIGIPLLYMELALGQFTSTNAFHVFERMAPAFVGVGLVSLIFNILSMINDQMTVTFFVNLFVNSINVFSNEMPWHNCVSSTSQASCRELYHTCDQFQGDYGDLSPEIVEQLGLRFTSMGSICFRSRMLLGSKDGNEDWHLKDVDKVPLHKWFAGESMGQHLFWNVEISETTLRYTTWPSNELIIYMFLGWVTVYFLCQSTRRVIGGTATFAVIVTVTVLVTFGIIFLFVKPPEFPYIYSTQNDMGEVLLGPGTSKERVYRVLGMLINACFLVLRSLKLGHGGLIYLGAQHPFRTSLSRQCFFLVIVSTFIPLAYALCHMLSVDSYVLYLVNGDMERWLHVQKQNAKAYIFQSGHPILQLALFVQSLRLYKEYEPVVICLFSLMGILCTLGNKVVRVEVILSTIHDIFPVFSSEVGRNSVLHMTICFSSILMYFLVSRKGFEMMISFESEVVPFLGMGIVLCQLFVVCWIYGARRLLANTNAMTKGKDQESGAEIVEHITNAVIITCWSIIIPLVLISCLVGRIFLAFVEEAAAVHAIPMIFVVVILGIVPILFIVRMTQQYQQSNHFRPVLVPDIYLWGPRNADDRKYAQKMEKQLRVR